MRINHNISAMITQGSLLRVNRDMGKSIEKLSTGLRINSAADDAAGLGVSENLRTQVRGLGQALRNTQDAIALMNIAEGALNEQTDILQRMRELIIQARNDTYTSVERSYMGTEFDQLFDELDRIASATTYNGMQLFATPERERGAGNVVYPDNTGIPNTPHEGAIASTIFTDGTGYALGAGDTGSSHHFDMMIGANYTAQDAAAYNPGFESFNSSAANMITIQLGQMDANGLLSTNPQFNIPIDDVIRTAGQTSFSFDPTNDVEDGWIEMWAQAARGRSATIQDKFDFLMAYVTGKDENSVLDTFWGPTENKSGLERINTMRAYIGSMTNRLEHTVNNSMTQVAAQQAAESIIRDTDFAGETMNFTKNQILTQSATAMLGQANTTPKSVLSLLR